MCSSTEAPGTKFGNSSFHVPICDEGASAVRILHFATNVAFAKSGDLLFVLKDDAELTIARVNLSSFEPLKTYEVAESATWAQPVISGQRLFVKDVSTLTLWAFD